VFTGRTKTRRSLEHCHHIEGRRVYEPLKSNISHPMLEANPRVQEKVFKRLRGGGKNSSRVKKKKLLESEWPGSQRGRPRRVDVR